MEIKIILVAALILTALGLIAAIILFFVSKAFRVIEDPRIDEIAEKLPSANCGGCGFAGCRALAEAIVKNNTLDGYFCPAGANMEEIAAAMGLIAPITAPKIAVVRCKGSCENTVPKAHYNSAKSCLYAHTIFAGESGCSYGCLGNGDCIADCAFGALSIDDNSQLVKVDEALCTGCGACVTSCPRNIIELRLKGKSGRRVFVACLNRDKGVIAKRNCAVACIGCCKCATSCPFGAVIIENNLAYIDYEKCKLCRKCVAECPTKAIVTANFSLKTAEA